MNFPNKYFILLIAPYALLAGCVGNVAVPNTARAGDTVELALGRSAGFSRDNIQGVVYDSLGVVTLIPAGDPAFRAVVNLYPDPLSGLVVGTATNQNAGEYNNGALSGSVISSVTGGDEDWWQTVVFLDLPMSMATGTALLIIETLDGSESEIQGLEIIPGIGQPVDFVTTIGSLTSMQVQSLERVSHFVVSLSGVSLPYATSVTLSHDPDASTSNTGVGVPHIVNPRGDIKSIAWSGNGEELKIILTPTNDSSIDAFPDFKFYVTGGITGLQVDSVEAYDLDGNMVPGITATVLYMNQ